MQSLVSMVIPCYNKEEYIEDMLYSVIEQKWNNLEVIIVNDGSTDKTQRVIEQFIPKLLGRGFEVILINQENQGVASAVKNGLMRIKGEYVCFPDCDDLLHHDYVAALMKVLERSPEVDCVVCDDIKTRWDFGLTALEETEGIKGLFLNTECLIPEWILRRIMPSVWSMMLRSSVIEEVNIIGHFITNIGTTQEPQIWLPLLSAGKIIYHINQPLYINITRAESIMTSQKTVERIHYYAETRKRLIQATLKMNVNLDTKLEYYCKLSEIAYFDLIAQRLSCINSEEYLLRENERQFVKVVNFTKLLPVPLEISIVEQTGFFIAYKAVSNYLVGHVPEKENVLDIILNTHGRLIAYGAGKVAKQIIPSFRQCLIDPTVVWDKNAKKGDLLLDIPLAMPDFESLTNYDTVILLLNGNQDVEEKLNKYNARFFSYKQVLDSLANKYYPELAMVKYE